MKKRLAILLLLALLFTTALPALAATGQTPSDLTFTEMDEQIEALMNEHVGTTTPGAAIVVVHEGEIIFSRGYGWADIENQIPIDPATTVFQYASISKTFTWVAVMQLVEQGLLDLDADITTYLPESFVFEMSFTMRDLMNHSAGFADILVGLGFSDERLLTLEEALLVSQPNQIFTPGTVMAYSNWGAALAGFVVAEISGDDFAVFERENIHHPANMHKTMNLPDWFGNDSFLSNRAEGYIADGEGGFAEPEQAEVALYPTGGLNGTAEDLAAFIKALTPPAGESGPLFENAESLQTLFSPSAIDPVNRPGTYHGFFPYRGDLPGFGHGGGWPGFSTDFTVVPEARFGFVIFTNVGGEMELIPAARELLLGSSLQTTPTAGNNLPRSQAVEGRFISTRRYDGNFIEFINYVGLAGVLMPHISAIDENTITVSFGPLGSAIYVQTAPYVYHIYDYDDDSLLAIFFSELRFRMEDDVPMMIITDGGDFTSLPTGRTMPLLITNLFIAVLSAAFFLITPIVLFVIFLIQRKRQKKRTHFDRFSTGFLISGTLFVLNFLVLFLLFGINPFRTVAEVAPYIWINYILAGLAILLFVGSLWSWPRAGKEKTSRKMLFVVTTIFIGLLIFVLHNWHFFVLF